MKIQKVLSRKYKDKEYHKFILVIPEEEMRIAGIKEGEDLRAESKKGEIKIKRK
ncbi:MAG: hypothetical protein KKE50_04765 [Nanoarchaeota archaeon]|nr:hypothetical protein [Nanoarchaeota archaeon]